MNIERSRREYLKEKVQQVIFRKKYLETAGRKAQWKKEEKKQFKRCNGTFGK